jgi:hypothetical protein
VQESEGCAALRGSIAATVELDPVDPSDEGRADYAGPLLSDLDFGEFSHSALVRMVDEVCLQMHLLNLGFVRAVQARLDPEQAAEVCLKQLVGIAGVAADRLRACLDIPGDEAGNERLLALHPVRNPAAYAASGRSDGGWLALAAHPDVVAAITNRDPDDVAEEVLVTRMSSGAGWTFEPRRSLPLYPV